MVDDNITILETVKAMLEYVGHEALTADSGEACLELLRSGFRGVILMDFMMPELNGCETLKAIVDEGLFEGNVVCMLTGEKEPPAELETVSEYVLDYIRKPFSMAELIDPVELAMSCLDPDTE